MDNIIAIESASGPFKIILDRVLRMVPDRDRDDLELRRLLAFRLRIDGEGATREYLMRKIRDMIQCAYRGRMYDFLKDDKIAGQCFPGPRPTPSTPPDIA